MSSFTSTIIFRRLISFGIERTANLSTPDLEPKPPHVPFKFNNQTPSHCIIATAALRNATVT